MPDTNSVRPWRVVLITACGRRHHSVWPTPALARAMATGLASIHAGYADAVAEQCPAATAPYRKG